MELPDISDNYRDFPQIFQAIADATRPLRWDDLCELSNLSGVDLEHFEAGWSRIAAQRRLEIMRTLEEISAERYELVFRQVATVAMRDPIGDVRAAAISNLATEEDPALIAPLLQVVQHDTSPEARAAAAGCLGVFVYLGAIDDLPPAKLFEVEDALLAVTPDEHALVQRMALQALGFSSRPEVPPRIEAAAKSGDEAWLASAILAMGRSADSARWRPHVLAALTHPSRRVHLEAARAAGELELREALPELAEMVYAPAFDLQRVAIWALGEIGGAEARSTLIELQAVAENDEQMQLLIEEALANIDLMAGTLDFGLFDIEHLADLLESEDSEDEDTWH